MTTLTRFLLCAVVASGLLAGLASLSPEWFASANLDFWSLPELHVSISRCQVRQAELEAEVQRVGERLGRKQEAVAGLLEGRLTLFEAAARFREANRPHPESMRAMRAVVAGDSDEEKLCRQVLGWASAAATRHPTLPGAEKVVARCEAELQQHLAQHGRVILPQE